MSADVKIFIGGRRVGTYSTEKKYVPNQTATENALEKKIQVLRDFGVPMDVIESKLKNKEYKTLRQLDVAAAGILKTCL